MKNKKLNAKYWDTKYQNKEMGWDIGHASPPITTYIDQLTNKNISILIPGAGNGYEAEYLFNKGFKNITIVDLAQTALHNIKKRVTNFPKENLINENFFNHHRKYDLIIEQTFFCALSPNLRNNYVKNMHNLLNSGGKLVGLLFDFPLTEEGPPFGGSKSEYKNTFSTYFNINKMERSYNSIKPRAGTELFIIFEKD